MRIPAFLFASLAASLFCHRAVAQPTQSRDSLRAIIAANHRDSNSVTALLAYGDFYAIPQPDSAVYFFEKAHQLALALHWPRGIAAYDSHIIQVLDDRGKYREALTRCQEAIRIYADGGTPVDQVRAFNNIANEYQYLGELSKTVDNYLKAMRLADTLADRHYMKILCNNLASVFYELEQYDKCYAYAHRSYVIATDLKDTAGIASSLVNLGLSEGHLGREDSAMAHFGEILRIGRRLDDYTLLCDAYVNMASIYVRRHLPDMAKPEFDSVLAFSERYRNPNYKTLALAGLADVAIDKNEWKKADRFTRSAMAIAAQLGDRDNLVQLYDKEATVLEKMLDWKEALTFRNRFDTLNDSLLNEKTRNHINDIETRYQAAEKDHAIAEQRLQLERTQEVVRRRNTQLWFLAAGLAALVILLLLAWRLFRQRQQINRQALMTLQREQEVHVLKAVLQGQQEERLRIARELHDDMGAGLTTILYLSRQLPAGLPTPADTAKKIAATTTGLVDTMNEIVWSINQQYDSLEYLVAFIRRQASQILEANGLDYCLEIPDQIPDVRLSGEVRRNIFLAVKEALNNALRHAGATCITLRIEIGPRLNILVLDNGKGMPAGEPRRGNGLTNMRQRMDMVAGTLTIDTPGGTRVVLSVPL
ncbi:MAG TPA: ATP-binding protein [Puia sp.]|nr:ATP-binding protein [Puia sp.]